VTKTMPGFLSIVVPSKIVKIYNLLKSNSFHLLNIILKKGLQSRKKYCLVKTLKK
jgi:hypothetical protein